MLKIKEELDCFDFSKHVSENIYLNCYEKDAADLMDRGLVGTVTKKEIYETNLLHKAAEVYLYMERRADKNRTRSLIIGTITKSSGTGLINRSIFNYIGNNMRHINITLSHVVVEPLINNGKIAG